MENAIRMKVQTKKEKKNFFRIKTRDAFLLCLVVIIPGLISLSSASNYSSAKQTFNWCPYGGDNQSGKNGRATVSGYGSVHWKAKDSTFNVTLVSDTGSGYIIFIYTLGTTGTSTTSGTDSTIDVTHSRNGVISTWNSPIFVVGFSGSAVYPGFTMVDDNKSNYMVCTLHPILEVSGDTEEGYYTVKINLVKGTVEVFFKAKTDRC